MDEKLNHASYRAATNPVLAVRLSGAPRFPRAGYPEELRWCQMPELEVAELQEAIYNAIQALPQARLFGVIVLRFAENRLLDECRQELGGITKERVRQLEAQAIRKLRARIDGELMERLRIATEVVPIPGSALDPDWVDTREAARLTGYSRDHMRWLCRKKYIVCQINPLKRNRYQISRRSLETYIKANPKNGRKTGQWKEAQNV